jgi:hypothetical protein
MSRLSLLASALLLAFQGQASAGLIFDNLSASGGPSVITGTVGPAGFFTFGVELTFARDVRITRFELFNTIDRDGIFQFAIFDRPGNMPLFAGGPRSFAADTAGPSFKSSEDIDFTFRAGVTYALGATSSVGMAMPYAVLDPLTIDGITATGRDPNFQGIYGFIPPIYFGAAFVQGFVKLYDESAAGPVQAVPEPSSAVLCGMGVAALLWGRRRGSGKDRLCVASKHH